MYMKRDKETSKDWVWQTRKKVEDLLNKQEKVSRGIFIKDGQSDKSGTIPLPLHIGPVLFVLSLGSRENHDRFSVVSVSCPP